MKVTVTGGSGQLGTLVLRRLLADPAVTAVGSIDLRPPAVASKKLHAVTCDVRDAGIARHLVGCDALVHMAFVVSAWLPRERFEAINVGGSQNVFRAAAAAGVRRAVYLSSVAAYGVVPGHPVPLTESAPRVRQPEFPYAAAKYDVEAWLDRFESEQPQMAIARLRPSILVGADMDHPFGASLRRRTLVDLGDPTPLPVVWDEDVADAVMLALGRGARGAFNLSADEPLGIRELAAAGGMRVRRVPHRLALAMARASVLLSRFGLTEPVDPAWIEQLAPLVVSSARAERLLGWKRRARCAADVVGRFAATVPERQDPRAARFLRARRIDLPDLADVHLRLIGARGGDFTLAVRDGRYRARAGVPRPPSAVLIVASDRLAELLRGASDFEVAASAVYAEGDPGAMRLFAALLRDG